MLIEHDGSYWLRLMSGDGLSLKIRNRLHHVLGRDHVASVVSDLLSGSQLSICDGWLLHHHIGTMLLLLLLLHLLHLSQVSRVCLLSGGSRHLVHLIHLCRLFLLSLTVDLLHLSHLRVVGSLQEWLKVLVGLEELSFTKCCGLTLVKVEVVLDVEHGPTPEPTGNTSCGELIETLTAHELG